MILNIFLSTFIGFFDFDYRYFLLAAADHRPAGARYIITTDREWSEDCSERPDDLTLDIYLHMQISRRSVGQNNLAERKGVGRNLRGLN